MSNCSDKYGQTDTRYRRIIKFPDRVELHGSMDGENWVIVHTVPTTDESVKPRTALFKVANFFHDVSIAIGQPNAEILSMFNQALLTFAINASNELVDSVVDQLVCALFHAISRNTSDMIRDGFSKRILEDIKKGDK